MRQSGFTGETGGEGRGEVAAMANISREALSRFPPKFLIFCCRYAKFRESPFEYSCLSLLLRFSRIKFAELRGRVQDGLLPEHS